MHRYWRSCFFNSLIRFLVSGVCGLPISSRRAASKRLCNSVHCRVWASRLLFCINLLNALTGLSPILGLAANQYLLLADLSAFFICFSLIFPARRIFLPGMSYMALGFLFGRAPASIITSTHCANFSIASFPE